MVGALVDGPLLLARFERLDIAAAVLAITAHQHRSGAAFNARPMETRRHVSLAHQLGLAFSDDGLAPLAKLMAAFDVLDDTGSHVRKYWVNRELTSPFNWAVVH